MCYRKTERYKYFCAELNRVWLQSGAIFLFLIHKPIILNKGINLLIVLIVILDSLLGLLLHLHLILEMHYLALIY